MKIDGRNIQPTVADGFVKEAILGLAGIASKRLAAKAMSGAATKPSLLKAVGQRVSGAVGGVLPFHLMNVMQERKQRKIETPSMQGFVSRPQAKAVATAPQFKTADGEDHIDYIAKMAALPLVGLALRGLPAALRFTGQTAAYMGISKALSGGGKKPVHGAKGFKTAPSTVGGRQAQRI